MKIKTLFLAALIALTSGYSCKKMKDEGTRNNPENLNTWESPYWIVTKHNQVMKERNTANKTVQLFPVDSLPYYLNVLGNVLIADHDTILCNLRDSSVTLALTGINSTVNLLNFSLQLLAWRQSLLSNLPQNEKVYQIDVLNQNINGTFTLNVVIGKIPAFAALGKAYNPITNLFFFSSTQNYRMGYGNEIYYPHLNVVGGGTRKPRNLPEGNGLISYPTYYIYYGGTATSGLPSGINKPAGAASLLEAYAHNNIAQVYSGGIPVAPPGYTFFHAVVDNTLINENDYTKIYDYRNAFTKDNPFYNPNDIVNRTNQHLPSLIFAKFCQGQQSLSGLSHPSNPSYAVYQPHVLTANMLNYYLSKIPVVYNNARARTTSEKTYYRLYINPIYDPGRTNCSTICIDNLKFGSTQLTTPVDDIYFPDQRFCVNQVYHYQYLVSFSKRVIVPNPVLQ